MTHTVHHIPHGTSMELSAAPASPLRRPELAIVCGGGRGSSLKLDGPFAGIWIPLRGYVQLGPDISLCPGEARVTEPDARLDVTARGNAIWLAILGTPPAWRDVVSVHRDTLVLEPTLVPAQHVADRDLRRLTLTLVRAAIESKEDPGSGKTVSPLALIDRIVRLQEEFSPAIARCRGRTYAQRRQVFLRLQRVRNYLSDNCHLETYNDTLARMASYSPCHFIRAFRAVYCETPHAYLIRKRLERARRLLRASHLAIAEVAAASGFENRCAFSRLFRQHFGVTAGGMRRSEEEKRALAIAAA